MLSGFTETPYKSRCFQAALLKRQWPWAQLASGNSIYNNDFNEKFFDHINRNALRDEHDDCARRHIGVTESRALSGSNAGNGISESHTLCFGNARCGH
jgi:hypothetical protein